jgi:hypothetical protein
LHYALAAQVYVSAAELDDDFASGVLDMAPAAAWFETVERPDGG